MRLGAQWLKELRKVALTVAGTAKASHLFPFSFSSVEKPKSQYKSTSFFLCV
jgi:hypothetical protein